MPLQFRGRVIVWFSLLLVLLLTGQGFSQCFTGTDCTGDTLLVASQRECCIATTDGLSYRDGTSCNLCIVHGFVSAVYNVDEEDRLDTMFRLNVKGRTNFGDALNIQGVITAMAGGTAENSDFEELQPIRVANNVRIRLFTRNDETTLEYDDSVILTFTPDNPALIGGLEGEGEYVRASAIVNIIDDDQLQINFEESDYSITEGSILSNPIRVQFRNNQNAFNITISPVTITTAEGKGLGTFINSGTIEEESRATAGADFTDMTITIEVPASTTDGAQVFELPKFFDVINDDIDEFEQSFAIVAEIGPDVPDTPNNFSCFQRQAGGIICFGRRGATEIRIIDNDPMIIGFTTRSRTVSEGDTQPGSDLNRLTIDVAILRTSERRHTIVFRHLENRNTAIVQSNFNQNDPLFDALFGNENNDPIEERFILQPGESEVTSRVTMVRNDFRPEDDECYTIGIFTTDIIGPRELFSCNDEPDASEFFCDHTICIIDDDVSPTTVVVNTKYVPVTTDPGITMDPEPSVESSSSDNTTAIIGAAVAIVIVVALIIAITVAIIAIVALRYRHGNLSLKNAETFELTGLPSPAMVEGTAIITTDNEAYGVMIPGGEPENGYEMVDSPPGGPPPADEAEKYEVPSPPLCREPLPATPTVTGAGEPTPPPPVTGAGQEEEEGVYEIISGDK